MKYLIVNADDFGAGRGINRGVAECHERGVLTSASLMVTMPAAGEAAILARGLPRLGVGLHALLTEEDGRLRVDPLRPDLCRREIERQLRLFEDRLGRRPTHLDAHHNIHRHGLLRPVFLEVAAESGLPLREHSPVQHFSEFYGQWGNGETHLEWIGVENLIHMLANRITDGITELSCHPGYSDGDFHSSYLIERETERTTICDPRVRDAISRLGFRLTNYAGLSLYRMEGV